MADRLNWRADVPDTLPVHPSDIDIINEDGWGEPVVTVIGEFLEPAEVNRRALLVAAAPELLAALEELGRRFSQLAFTFGVWDQVQDSLAQIDAAIAKARGEASDAGR